MKTTLVNHSGIIQEKFIIKTDEELFSYHLISSQDIALAAMSSMTNNKSQLIDIIKETSAANKEPMLVSATRIAKEKTMLMQKALLEGKTIVVNMAGGWTFWDDNEMSIVDESERKLNDSPYLPKVNISNHQVLVLENQEKITVIIERFLKKELNVEEYSSIIRMNTDYNGEAGKWIFEAISKGCNTIVFESQLINPKQISNFVELFLLTPPLTFYIFTMSDLKNTLIELVGTEKTNNLFSKHTINLINGTNSL